MSNGQLHTQLSPSRLQSSLAPQLFGVQPEHGTLRVEWSGVIMFGGRKAFDIEPNWILFGNVSGYRNTPGARTSIPIWEFAARK